MATPEYKRVNELPLGSKVVFGKNKFNGKYQDGEEDIVWIILSNNHSTKDSGYPEDAVTMITKDVIRYMSFDAKEPSNTLSDRQISGNNRWRTSNIRQWLNSEGFANQWFVPQNIGVSGTDNKDTPPTAEYMLNITRNYPYYNDTGFLRFFTDAERSFIKPATISTMIPTVSEDGSGIGKLDKTTDYVYLPSLTEITQLQNGLSSTGTLINEGSYLLTTSTLKALRSARATQLALTNGANYGLNPITDKVYFYRSPAQTGNDIRRFADNAFSGSSTNVKPSSNDGIRPMTNIDANAIVVKEGQDVYRFIDNAKPYITIDATENFDIYFSIYDYDNKLSTAVIQLNNEQMNSFSVSGQSIANLNYRLPYEKMMIGVNVVKIITTDEMGNEGVKTLHIRMDRKNVPVIGDTISTQHGHMTVIDTLIDSRGTLTLTLSENLKTRIKFGNIVEKIEHSFTPSVAINDDYNSLPLYQNMTLKSIDFDKDSQTAIEEWEHVGIGKYAHTKIKMIRDNAYSTQYLSRVSQIYTYYDED